MDPNFTNEDMAYTLAHEGKCLYLRKLLKKHRMHVDAISHLLSIACEYGDVDIVEFLMNQICSSWWIQKTNWKFSRFSSH